MRQIISNLVLVLGILSSVLSFASDSKKTSTRLHYGLSLWPSQYRRHELSAGFHFPSDWGLYSELGFGKTSGSTDFFDLTLGPTLSINKDNKLGMDLSFYHDATSYQSGTLKFTYEWDAASAWDGAVSTWIKPLVLFRRDVDPLTGPFDLLTHQWGAGLGVTQDLGDDYSVGVQAILYSQPSSSLGGARAVAPAPSGGRGRGRGGAVATAAQGHDILPSGGEGVLGPGQIGLASPSGSFEKYNEKLTLSAMTFDPLMLDFSINRFAYFGDAAPTWAYSPGATYFFSDAWSGEVSWLYKHYPYNGGSSSNTLTVGVSYQL